jgi:hypothetical protein
MVDCSGDVGVNKAQLVGTHDSQVIVPVYDWASFYSPTSVNYRILRSFIIFDFLVTTLVKFFCKEFG